MRCDSFETNRNPTDPAAPLIVCAERRTVCTALIRAGSASSSLKAA